MSSFLCKSIILSRYRYRYSVRNPINACCYSLSLRWLSNVPKEQSFMVSYLINSLGFSQHSALMTSKHISFKTSDNPDKVIAFLSEFGFTHTQISKLVRSLPRVLVLDAEKIIYPKLEFFESKGISRPELAKSLSVFPTILGQSLDRKIKPSYEFFRGFLRSDDKTISALRRRPDFLFAKSVGLNIAALQEHGVPNSTIATAFHLNPVTFLGNPVKFRMAIHKVVEMGFNASMPNFALAVAIFGFLRKSKWEDKVETYKKWGWSGEQFLEAFRREPRCMLVSEAKITACMDFITSKMGRSPDVLVKFPLALMMSLEKRVIPRCLVYRLLLSRGLLRRPLGLSALICPSEKVFLQKFVTPFEDESLLLSRLYEEKVCLLEGRWIGNVRF